MRKLINFSTISKRSSLAMFALASCVLILSFTSCRKEWPELGNQPDEGSTTPWSSGQYRLKSSAGAISDTLVVYQGIAATFTVLDASNQVVGGVDFNFGDGNVLTGSTVSHIYSFAGRYTLTAIVNGTTISGPVKVIIFGEPVADEVVINVYHAMVGGMSQDTIGLAISNIAKAWSDGSFFITGDFNSWLSPQAASITNAKLRIIHGRRYLLWGTTHALGVEKFGYGKALTDGSSSWNYSTKSTFWHTNSTGGNLWIYYTSTGISYAPEGSTLPGTFGDVSTIDWTLRYGIAYGASSSALTIFVNKSKIVNANAPEVKYKFGVTGTDVTKPLVDGGGSYYTVVVDSIPYGTILCYNLYARTGEIATKIITTNGGYNDATSSYALQINDPYK